MCALVHEQHVRTQGFSPKARTQLSTLTVLTPSTRPMAQNPIPSRYISHRLTFQFHWFAPGLAAGIVATALLTQASGIAVSMTGHKIIEVESIKHAIDCAKSCPFLGIDSTLKVAQIVNM